MEYFVWIQIYLNLRIVDINLQFCNCITDPSLFHSGSYPHWKCVNLRKTRQRLICHWLSSAPGIGTKLMAAGRPESFLKHQCLDLSFQPLWLYFTSLHPHPSCFPHRRVFAFVLCCSSSLPSLLAGLSSFLSIGIASSRKSLWIVLGKILPSQVLRARFASLSSLCHIAVLHFVCVIM